MLNYAIIGFGGLGKSHFENTADLMSKVNGIKLVDFIDCIKTGREITINPPESSKASVEIALAEKESANKKETITL